MRETDQPRHFWNRYVGPDGKWRFNPVTGSKLTPPGEELAALRTGLAVPPGTAMKVWPFCATPVDDTRARLGRTSLEQRAEHAALALYGLHQQSQGNPMHRPGLPIGAALRTLRARGRYSEAALDRRVNAAATATSTTALLTRLRGLITQLRGEGIPLDYDALLRDLTTFEHPARRPSVRRAWGAAYYGWRTPEELAGTELADTELATEAS